MKNIYIVILMVLLAAVPTFAQQKNKKSREEMRKELREFKINYLVQEMELNDEQKAKFIPIYEKMSQERWQLFRETRQLERKVRDNKGSEADYKAVTKAMNNAKERDAEIEKAYDAQFAKFLTAKQIYKMHEAEGEFMRRMHKMRKKK